MPSIKDPSSLVRPSDGGPPAGTSTGGVAASLLWGPGPNWADGTTNPATTLSAEVSKIIVDLSSLSGGTAKIGGAALVGANDTIAAGTLFAQLGLLKQAAHIEYAGGGAWADSSTNPATLVENQLDKIISDLGGINGTAKIGSAALVGASGTIASGTAFGQLQALRAAANHDYAGGGNWRDGTTNPATSVESQLDKIIADLVNQAAGFSGAEKIGCNGIIGTSSTIPFGTIYSVLSGLKNASSLDYAGGPTWADGTTNPAASVESQLDKIISDLNLTSGSGGSGRIGSSAIVGANDTIAAGTLASQLLLLKQASHIEYAGGPTWADGTTNPATLVESQLDKILTDIGGSGGASKVGATTVGNFTGANVQTNFAQLTQTAANNDGAKRVGAEVKGGFQAGELTVRAQLDGLDTRKYDKTGGTITGQVTINGSGANLYPQLSNFVTETRDELNIHVTTIATMSFGLFVGSTPCIAASTSGSGGSTWIKLRLPADATVTQVAVSWAGNILGSGLNAATYQIVSLAGNPVGSPTTMTTTALSSVVSDTHGGTFLQMNTQTITPTSGSFTVDPTKTYFLKVTHFYTSSGTTQTEIYRVQITLTNTTIHT